MGKITGLLKYMSKAQDVADALVKKYNVPKDVAEDAIRNNKWMNLEGALVDEPQNTRTVYKLFDQRPDNELYPLFVGADKPFVKDDWSYAQYMKPNEAGRVDAKLSGGEGKPGLAFRPGLHSGSNPFALNIGKKLMKPPQGKPDFRPRNQVWGEVTVPDDYDWYNEAMMRAKLTKQGKINLKTAEIKDQLPFGGTYNYNTNANVAGDWTISDRMKINRILDPDEVAWMNQQNKVSDLPYVQDLIKAALNERQGKLSQKDITKSGFDYLKSRGLLDLIKYK